MEHKYDGTFGTLLACMDGRQISIVHDWVIATLGVDYVDVLTAPGSTAGIHESEVIEFFQQALEISVKVHGSKLVVIAVHDECAGDGSRLDAKIATAHLLWHEFQVITDVLASTDIRVVIVNMVKGDTDSDWTPEVVYDSVGELELG